VGESVQDLELEISVIFFEKILQLAMFSQPKDETLKMLYMGFLKLKEDIQSIIDLEAPH
jgi:hypothetical protein